MARLLERERQLEVLHECLADTRRGEGRLVFLGGEAGAGKTALLSAFGAAARGEWRILTGRCDSLITPRPLGPFVDVAADTGGALAELVGHPARAHEVLAGVVEELHRRPTVLFLEDLHWADGATLDVVRLLGRRVEAVRAFVVVTYRDDEVGASHPLRVVLGELAATRGVRRLALEPLSLDAVAELATPQGLDAAQLHRLTGGNPFFVTEAVAAGLDGVPETVRDAVLARAAHLGARPRRLLDVVAVITPRAEVSLLEAVAADELRALADCMAAGMLVEEYGGIGFRHELARAAVEEAIAPDRRRTLHRAVLEALRARGRPDLSRLAHHAEAAGDADAVLELAPAAAERSALVGAHREAAEHLGRALRFAEGLPAREVAELLESRAYECYLVDQIAEALLAQRAAYERYVALGDRLKQGDVLRWISRLTYLDGRAEEARTAALEAVSILESLPPGEPLVHAYAQMAQTAQIDLDLPSALAWGERALTLATELGADELALNAQTSIGIAEAIAGQGSDRLEDALQEALRHGSDDTIARLYGALSFTAVRRLDWIAADRWLQQGMRHATERDLDSWRLYLLGWRAAAALDRGRWDDAAADVGEILRHPHARLTRVWGLLALGLVRARRGDPDVWAPLGEAAELTTEDTAQKLVPLRVIRAEAAYLAGEPSRALEETGAVRVSALVDRRVAGKLAVWRRRAGGPAEATGPLAEPYELELAGEHEGAAAAWAALECPYDSAFVLSLADDPDAIRRAHERLLELGARPAAALAARRLRERGERGLARGPRQATRDNPAGLTAREVDVLRLVAEGLRNAEIAERLFVSAKTVDHHVSAILRKLSARTRAEASAEAVRLGLLQQG